MRSNTSVAIASIAVEDTDVAASDAIDAQYVVAISALAITTDDAAGTLQIQASNDIPPFANALQQGFEPTNWSDLLETPLAVAAATPVLIPYTNSAYRYLRVVYTNATGAGNVSVNVTIIGLN